MPRRAVVEPEEDAARELEEAPVGRGRGRRGERKSRRRGKRGGRRSPKRCD